MIQQQHEKPKTPAQTQSADTVERLLKQAEIFRLTRSLKSKLAQASLKTQKPPAIPPNPGSDQRRRAKTLEGASPAPRAVETPASLRPSSRRSSFASVRSNASASSQLMSPPSLSSPRSRISRIDSTSSIPETLDNSLALQSPIGYSPQQYVYPTAQTPGSRDSFYQNPNPHAPHQPTQFSPQPRLHSQQSPTPGYSSTHMRHSSSGRIPSLTVSSSSTQDEEKHQASQLPREPQTPPARRRTLPKTPDQASTADGANLLLHFAHSPGRGTPRTPDFNVNDYLHFQTPSPARGQLTPRQTRYSSLNSALFAPNIPALPYNRPTEFGSNNDPRL